MHGYALVKEYRDRSGLEVANGNLYRELQRLVTTGLVKSADRSDEEDARRVPYEITKAGRAAFDAWLSDPRLLATEHADELCARAVFLDESDRARAEQLLVRWHDELWVRLKLLERSRELAKADANGSRVSRTVVLLYARRLKHVAADIEFVQELRGAWEAPVAEATHPEQRDAERLPKVTRIKRGPSSPPRSSSGS